MIILIHILIALSSLIYTTYLCISPSRKGLNISYSLIAATLASGTVLVIVTRSNMLQSCVSGLVYLAIALSGVLVAHKRLVKQEINIFNKIF